MSAQGEWKEKVMIIIYKEMRSGTPPILKVILSKISHSLNFKKYKKRVKQTDRCKRVYLTPIDIT